MLTVELLNSACILLFCLYLWLVKCIMFFFYIELFPSTLIRAPVCTFVKYYGFTRSNHFHCPNKQAPMCFDCLSFSFVKVMAGSRNLQTFRLLRYLRGRISAEGQVNYGLQMAVSIINSSD